MFITLNIICESFSRLYEPEKIEGDALLLVAVLGLLVNIVGLMFFHDHHGHSHEEHSHSSHTHSHIEDEECGEHHHSHKH